MSETRDGINRQRLIRGRVLGYGMNHSRLVGGGGEEALRDKIRHSFLRGRV